MITQDSICRCCTNGCAIKVDVEDGRAVRVRGNPENPLYKGFTCIKGRSQPAYLYHPNRLLHSLKRTPSGGFEKIGVQQAMDEIAERLIRIRDEYGSRALATYSGTMMSSVNSTTRPIWAAFVKGLGTTMTFDPNTLDKGGKQIAEALHGQWLAPSQGFDEPEAVLLLGINPLVTFTGFPAGNPGQWLKENKKRGMKLIVVDPRRSDVAERADLYLAAHSGTDAEILAAIIRIILAENLHDQDFVAAHVANVDRLRAAVDPFTPEVVAQRAGIAADALIEAARLFGSARRGYAMAGTGPSMSANGSLIEYLVMCLESLCGHWLRAGERVKAAPTLEVVPDYRAQAKAPAPRWQVEKLRVRGLYRTPAGMPGSALADEILTEGEGRIRSLFCINGNPAATFPDQIKTTKALRSLDLLVAVDPWMTRTSELADYIIAPTMPLEIPAASTNLEFMTKRMTGYGLGVSYAQYSPAVIDPPAGSDLIEEWRLLVGLAERMGIPMNVVSPNGRSVTVDSSMTSERLVEEFTQGGRVPLSVVKEFPGGALFPDETIVVKPGDPRCGDRLDVGNQDMMDDLAQIAARGIKAASTDEHYPLRLLCRRHRHVFNTSCNFPETHRGRAYNPAYMNSADLAALAIAEGDIIEIESARSAVHAVAAIDDAVRLGYVSLVFGYGADPERDHELYAVGSSANRLIPDDSVFDRYTGQPRMSNLPVRVRAASSEFVSRLAAASEMEAPAPLAAAE